MMARITTVIVLGGALAIASAAHAQGRGTAPERGGAPMNTPGELPMMGGMSRDVASMLLSHTGELTLTDAQVTRLAAIARRTADRRQSMRASMDSVMRPVRDTTARRAGAPPAARAMMERLRDQAHTDLRDALAVLTADQLARAWEMVAQRGGPPGPMGGGMRSRMSMRQRMPMPLQPRSSPRGQ